MNESTCCAAGAERGGQAYTSPMYQLEPAETWCPYCGEHLNVLLDPQDLGQTYTEDCQVCCQPILFHIAAGAGGGLDLQVKREDD